MHIRLSKLTGRGRWATFGSIVIVLVAAGAIAVKAIGPPPVTKYKPKLAQAGYTLVAPLNRKDAYLVNNKGKVVHEWKLNNYAGAVTKLLSNGLLLRTYQAADNFSMGGRGGGIELVNWDGSVKWNYKYDTKAHDQHHDAIMLPNGDIMMLSWVKIPKAKAIAAGVNPKNIDSKSKATWSDQVIEVNPSNNKIVWKWNAWDHLIQDYSSSKPNYGSVAKNPQRINANYYAYSKKPDWLHTNALSYNPQTDQVIISVREFNEFWVIDHSTTTAQAATSHGGNSGMGGDLLYRYGNPAAYDHGTKADRTLYLQHDVHWVKQGLPGAGNVLVFNNGDNKTGKRTYSSVLELRLPRTGYTYAKDSTGAYAQPKVVWTYAPTGQEEFFSNIMGSAQRLPNGDTLVTNATHGRAIEVNPEDKQVWNYKSPYYNTNLFNKSGPKTNNVFRMYKYPPDYSGLSGHKL